MVWYSHLFKNVPEFVVVHAVKENSIHPTRNFIIVKVFRSSFQLSWQEPLILHLLVWLSLQYIPWFGVDWQQMGTKVPMKKEPRGTSPVVWWWRICQPVQGTPVQSLFREHSTCLGATEPLHHNYWACALEPLLAMTSSLCSPHLEKACTQQWRPRPAKNRSIIIRFLKEQKTHTLKKEQECILKNLEPLWTLL